MEKVEGSCMAWHSLAYSGTDTLTRTEPIRHNTDASMSHAKFRYLDLPPFFFSKIEWFVFLGFIRRSRLADEEGFVDVEKQVRSIG